MNKEFLYMQKLAGLITESEYKEKMDENNPSSQEWVIYAQEKDGKKTAINRVPTNKLNTALTNIRFQYRDDADITISAMAADKFDKLYKGKKDELMEDEEYEDEEFDLNQAFKDAPNEAPYKDVLDIIKSYEMDDVLKDFKAEFPKGKPVSKSDYSEFAMSLIDDMSEVDFVQANWISIFDEDIYEKAGMI